MAFCENPRKIKNPSRRFGLGVSKNYIVIPCGNCPACRENQRKEWSNRANIQFKHCVESGGRVIFITLTYNEQCIPMLDLEDFKLRHGSDKSGIRCFDKADIQTFVKSLKKKLQRKYNILNVKYLVTMEYGAQTHRPHYHALFYIPRSKATDAQLADDVQSSWHLGIAKYSDLGPFVKSFDGCEYVCKYVCKDLDFYGLEELKYVLYNKTSIKKIKRFLPTHLQSKGFGEDLAQWLLHKEDVLPYFQNGVGQEYFGAGVDRLYQVPRYIMNKLLYYDKNGVRYVSDFGKKIMMQLYDFRMRESDRKLSSFFNFRGLANYLNDDDAYKIIPTFKHNDYDNTINGVRTYLFDLLGDRSIRELSLYKKVFANLTLPHDATEEDLAWFESASAQHIDVFAHVLSDTLVSDPSWYNLSDEPWKYKANFDILPTYNRLKRFENFDELLDALNQIQSIASHRRQEKKAEDFETTRRLKKLFQK